MWAQLNQEYEGSGVNMAQVNCAVNGGVSTSVAPSNGRGRKQVT